MNLNYELSNEDRLAVHEEIGERIRYCVPADLSLTGRRTLGYFVIGDEKWAYVEAGNVKESGHIAEAQDYKVVPLVGNAILEATDELGKRIIVRVSMEHIARFSYIAQILNYMATNSDIRIYNEEEERVCSNCGNRLHQATRVCPKCMNKAAVLKRLLGVSKSHWRMLVLGLIILFFTSAITLLGPYFQKLLVNSSLQPPEGQSPSLPMFFIAIGGILFSLVGGELLNVAKGRVMATVGSTIAADLRKLVYEKIQNLSLGFLTSQRAGDLMNRVTSDTNRIRRLIEEVFTTAIYQMIMLIAVTVLLLMTDWRLALIVLLPAPFVAYLQFMTWRVIVRRLFTKQWRIFDKANSYLHDVLSGIRVVKTFGKEEREIKRFRQYNTDYAAAAFKAEKVYAVLTPISTYLLQISTYFVLLVGCNMILKGNLNLGELVQFTGYASMIFGPLAWMMNMPRWVANAVIAIDRIFSVIDEDPEILDKDTSIQHSIHGTIQFNDVTFGYKSYEPVLKDINVEIKPGEMIGLVGHSGSGKSTFINLVSRFYDVNEGQILIDGIDIRTIKQEVLRSQIGVVLQETMLFRGSIMENIRYSKPDATMEEVIQAARIANAHEFIIKLPDGYDTRLEENGNNLSGGERQRITIARAVLHNPRILILDEATASLDIDTESAIQEALQRITKNRTTIAIAHRLSTLKNADRLFVLEKGKVAEVGTHQELMQKQGIYYGLIMSQRNMTKAKAKTG
ncbi:ABC transporter ATP-binding protein [Lederbergia wuyishanensis]|uniref:ATP-binding cassette subfamily B protein n=1 Tax=Lederbergia wuyishanensis TaxID=1347903 RepID=A0ABU0D305_9BACI|nr:ABC transporter ATP-binding protein [Lederbergia wuyishanensis]MCJ8007081.1 ABC transporter ATP-binding protein/permease [Lederbergia wuyishanensis]MDQ0342775.1 ATP-binding cassette subfamily B protein [Lederbergia wuyishanensis]